MKFKLNLKFKLPRPVPVPLQCSAGAGGPGPAWLGPSRSRRLDSEPAVTMAPCPAARRRARQPDSRADSTQSVRLAPPPAQELKFWTSHRRWARRRRRAAAAARPGPGSNRDTLGGWLQCPGPAGRPGPDGPGSGPPAGPAARGRESSRWPQPRQPGPRQPP